MRDPVSGGGWSDGDVAAPTTPTGPRYERRQRLGRGGMGVVTVVWDHLLQREVALKEAIQPDGSLLHEARLTAVLDHPNIVPIYDATTEADGRVTYTMRLLRGQPLDHVLATTPSGPARLRWLRALLAACEAVAHAHGLGVVHRDLKPANIVVGELGETQVVDWGLARRAGDPAPSHEGTPGFTSPEQTRGDRPAPTDDVWALGRTLAVVLGDEALPELQSIIDRATAPLDTRYPDARALAEELADFLDGRRVRAYTYSPLEVAVRFVRQHRLTVGVAALVALVGLLAVAWQVRQTAMERDRALAAEAETRQELATSLGGRASHALRDGMLPEAEVLAVHALHRGASPEALGVLASLAAGTRAVAVATRALPPGCRTPLLAGGTVLCAGADGVTAWDPGATTPRWRSPLVASTLVASRDRVLVMESDFRSTLHRLTDGTTVGDVVIPAARRSRAFADRIVIFGDAGVWTWKDDIVTVLPSPCPDAEILQDVVPDAAICDGGSLVVDGVVRATPFTRVPGIPASLVRVGRTVWIGTFSGEVAAWDIDQTRVVWSSDVGVGAVMTLRHDGDRLLAVGSRGARVLDPTTGSPIAALPAAARPAEPRDGELWTVGAELVRWTVAVAAPRRELTAGVGLAGGTISPDGQRIALAGGSGHLSVWSVSTGERLGMVQDGSAPLKGPIFLAEGRVALAGPALQSPLGLRRVSGDGVVLPPIPPAGGIKRLIPLGAGFAAIRFGTGGPTRHDALGRILSTTERPGPALVDFAASLDRTEGVGIDEAGTIFRLDAQHFEAVDSAPGAHAVAVSRVGRAWAGEHVVHVDKDLDHPWSTIIALAITPDGRRVVTGGLDGTARVLDTATGELVAVLTGHDERIAGVEVAPDGSWVLTTSWDQTARRWDLSVLDAPVPALPSLSLEAALQATAR